MYWKSLDGRWGAGDQNPIRHRYPLGKWTPHTTNRLYTLRPGQWILADLGPDIWEAIPCDEHPADVHTSVVFTCRIRLVRQTAWRRSVIPADLESTLGIGAFNLPPQIRWLYRYALTARSDQAAEFRRFVEEGKPVRYQEGDQPY